VSLPSLPPSRPPYFLRGVFPPCLLPLLKRLTPGSLTCLGRIIAHFPFLYSLLLTILPSGNWARLSILVKEGWYYTLSLFGTSNSGGTLTLAVDAYLQKGKAVVRREGRREGGKEIETLHLPHALYTIPFLTYLSPLSLPPSLPRPPRPPSPQLTGTINGRSSPTLPSFPFSLPAWPS